LPAELNDPTMRIVVGPHDAVPEILSRLRSGRSASAIVTIPAASSLFLTASEFRALKATAEQARRSLTIETDDRLRKQLAEMFALPVVELSDKPPPVPDKTSVVNLETGRGVLESSDEPESGDESSPKPVRRRPPKPGRTWGSGKTAAIAGGVVAALIVVALVISYLLQTATVEITTKRTPVTADVVFAVVDQGAAAPAGSAFTVQGLQTTFDVPFTTSIPTTGKARTNGATAAGTLELRNTSDKDIAIPAGTTFTSFDGVSYFFTADVTVPAFNKTTKTPGQAEGKISASAGGANGNKDAGMLTGKLDSGVYYSNRGNIVQGGNDNAKQGVAQADIDNLVNQAKTQIPDLAKTMKIGNGMAVLPGSIKPGDFTYTTDHKVGDEASELTITAKMSVTALAYSGADFQKQAASAVQPALNANVPGGYQLVPDTLSFADPVQLNDQGSSAQFKVTATEQARALIDSARAKQIAGMIAGKSVGDASDFLGTLPEVDSVKISSSPGFLPKRIPGSAGRITVKTK
jgi:hypothetical protein